MTVPLLSCFAEVYAQLKVVNGDPAFELDTRFRHLVPSF